jgi:formamidopyrimidine-DNA glycosylase
VPELPEVEVVRAGLEPAVSGALITSVDVVDERGITRHDRARGDVSALLVGARMLGAARRGKFLWLPLEARELEVRTSGARLPEVRVSGARVPVVQSPTGHVAVVQSPTAQVAVVQGPTAQTRGSAASVSGPGAGSGAADAVLLHLGMSGQVLLREAGAPLERHARVRLTLEHPVHGELAVHFVDQRTFGSLAVDRLLPTPDGAAGGFGVDLASVPSQVAHIARDPLDPAFDDEGFVRMLQGRRTTVKRALLDQTLVSGVGNIYADEALWASRIHFDQPTATLSRRKANELLLEVRAVLHKALAEGGTSFDAQYVNVNGASGYFAHSLNAYGRTGLPCPRCGTPIVRASFMNRSSHFCPRCQRVRMPRVRLS